MIGASTTLYRPSRWGDIFHGLTHWEALGAGSAGPGKTMVLIMDPVRRIVEEHERCRRAIDHPYPLPWKGSVGWALHLRRTRPMLEQTIARSQRIFPVLDPDAHWDRERTTWIFRSGYRLQFGHCKDPDDWDIYMSQEYDWMGFDELIQFTEEQYDQLKTRVRSSDPVLSKMLKIRAMSNPVMNTREMVGVSAHHNPNWVRDYFVKPWPEGGRTLERKVRLDDGRTVTKTRIYLRALLKDNPDPNFRLEYEANLQTTKAHIRQALLYGDWWATAGSYYGEEWNRQLHVCRPFKIPADWSLLRSMDWGYKAPGCLHWGALDPEGTLWVFRELMFQMKSDAEVAVMIRSIEEDIGCWDLKSNRSEITGVADTQLWEERGEKTRTKAQVMADMGIRWERADKRSKVDNAFKLSKRLADHDSGTKTPGIVFFETCREIITLLPSIQTDPQLTESPADSKDDHAHDSVLYMVARASLPLPRREVVRSEPWQKKPDVQKSRSRGRYGYGSSVC